VRTETRRSCYARYLRGRRRCGFRGYEAARRLSRHARGAVEVVLINPTDYLPLPAAAPEVAGGVLNRAASRRSLAQTLPGVRLVFGKADARGRRRPVVHWTGPEGHGGDLRYDRLVSPQAA
jgi:NADH dehydrogenase